MFVVKSTYMNSRTFDKYTEIELAQKGVPVGHLFVSDCYFHLSPSGRQVKISRNLSPLGTDYMYQLVPQWDTSWYN